MYIAHKNDEDNRIQTVEEHSKNTALLCMNSAISQLKNLLYMMGLLHDVGKYQKSFQKRINGENIHVEHAMCGAVVARDKYEYPINILMEYCIAGHHTGLPNAGYINDTGDMTTLYGRMNREVEDYSAYSKELELMPLDKTIYIRYLVADCDGDKDKLIDKFAFLTRYCFSCLTDADTIDTAGFCNTIQRPLTADFAKCLDRINNILASFVCVTELQKARACLQEQVFSKVREVSEIYLMNMPTGSGKTLCSMKFALERAIRENKKRIIYIIPYNSIIDQTVKTFEDIFKEDAEILRHQSTFSYDSTEDYDEDYYQVMKFATENWDAQIIITTAVQFFESIYSNKRGKLRKLHNMSESILVFDEAHLMPPKYLQPCLQGISYITKYLNSEAIFLTATMPDYKELIEQYGLASCQCTDLITDTTKFNLFQKCNYSYLGTTREESIIQKAALSPSSLIIVNKRSTARRIFNLCTGRKYHLSTYMTAFDRIRIINEIKKELYMLEEEYPNYIGVPDSRRITVISTSLIEAGVDLDFYTVFRELSGLDSILQAGGRCNREGKRKIADVYIFTLENDTSKITRDARCNITRGLLEEYSDISCKESIEKYYERVLFTCKEDITKNSMHNYTQSIKNIPFKKYAEDFELIDTNTISIVVAQDEYSASLIEAIRYSGVGSSRKLQQYTFSIYQNEFDQLLQQHVIDDYGSGIWCLTNPDYYDRKIGVLFEGHDYFI